MMLCQTQFIFQSSWNMNLNKNVNFQETQTQCAHKSFVFRLLLRPRFLIYHIKATNFTTFRKNKVFDLVLSGNQSISFVF